MRPIFLAFHHPTGAKKFAPLETANEPIFYLPAGVEDEVELETARPSGRNDVAQIGMCLQPVFSQTFYVTNNQ